MNESREKTSRSYDAESVVKKHLEDSLGGKRMKDIYGQRLEHLESIYKERNIYKFVDLEECNFEEELEKFADDPAQKASLTAGIQQMRIIKSLLKVVQDPKAYQNAAQTYLMEKDRRGGLPDDSARKAFRAHKTRLANTNRTRMDKDERKVLKQRQKNIALAEKLYIALQKEALGIA